MNYYEVIIRQTQETDGIKDSYDFSGTMHIIDNIYTIWLNENDKKTKYMQIVFAKEFIKINFYKSNTIITLITGECVECKYELNGFSLSMKVKLVSFLNDNNNLRFEYNLYSGDAFVSKNVLEITKNN